MTIADAKTQENQAPAPAPESGDDRTIVDQHLYFLYHYEQSKFLSIHDGFTCGRGKARLSIPQDSRLSRVHFEISIKEREVSIMDPGSSNGTRVNQFKVTPKQPVILKGNDIIEAGDQHFAFTLHRDPNRLPVLQEPVEEPLEEDLPPAETARVYLKLFFNPRSWDRTTRALGWVALAVWFLVILLELGTSDDFMPGTPHSPATLLLSTLLRLVAVTLPPLLAHNLLVRIKFTEEFDRLRLLVLSIPALLLTSSILFLLPDLRSDNRVAIRCDLQFQEARCLSTLSELHRYFLRLEPEQQKKILSRLRFKVPMTPEILGQLDSLYTTMFNHFKAAQYSKAVETADQVLGIREEHLDTTEIRAFSVRAIQDHQRLVKSRPCHIFLEPAVGGRKFVVQREFDKEQCVNEFKKNSLFYCRPQLDFAQAPRPLNVEFAFIHTHIGKIRCPF